ncbi:MAG: 16S rRNA (guanine(527)-N(7))-methyltransferase RsmG [Ignavibacteria bacterium]|nr:16S rRNA (guanine(527)-N(7))-methyltransferase RsmG [Ignavibacteria bacterium]
MNNKLSELLTLNKLSLDEKKIERLVNYAQLLLTFNKNINLISRKDEENILERHIIPCLIFSTMFKNIEQNVLDIGTGGGLPGVVFSIINEKSRITLIDSVGKKIKVVNEIVQKLGLLNVETIWTRAEDKNFIKKYSYKFDLIISRATADLETLIKYSKPLLKTAESKLACMKGGDKLEEEINLAKKRFNYIAIQKIPLIYLPENQENINQKFIIIVERINGRK